MELVFENSFLFCDPKVDFPLVVFVIIPLSLTSRTNYNCFRLQDNPFA